MSNEIVYEFPLNERIRVFIRLEQLFLQLDHFLAGKSAWDRRIAVSTLLNILTIFSRNDIKTEILKELDRQRVKFKQMSKAQDVNSEQLESILSEFKHISKILYQTNGKIGISTMKCSLFQDISQRSNIPGGTCSFDLPGFHHWLEQDEAAQFKNLQLWTKPFSHLRKAIDIILHFIRASSTAEALTSDAGFYQASLDNTQPYQLLRVNLDRSWPCFAEISGNRHRYTIRFMEPQDDNGRPKQSSENVKFNLTCCLF